MTAPNWQLDFCDYPTGWWIQEQGLTHTDPRCSAVQSPAFLCDCGALPAEWARRRAEALAPDETCVICGKPSKDAECGECFVREDAAAVRRADV